MTSEFTRLADIRWGQVIVAAKIRQLIATIQTDDGSSWRKPTVSPGGWLRHYWGTTIRAWGLGECEHWNNKYISLCWLYGQIEQAVIEKMQKNKCYLIMLYTFGYPGFTLYINLISGSGVSFHCTLIIYITLLLKPVLKGKSVLPKHWPHQGFE